MRECAAPASAVDRGMSIMMQQGRRPETRDQAIAVRDRAKSQGYDAVVVNPQ